MRKLGFILILIQFSSAVNAQRLPSNCQIKAEDSARIYQIAAEFSVQRLEQLQLFDSMNLAFSQPTMDTFARAIAAIYNSTGFPEIDTLKRLGGLGVFHQSIWNRINIHADPTLDWMIQLKNGNMPTEYPELNDFLISNQMKMTRYQPFTYMVEEYGDMVEFEGPYYIREAMNWNLKLLDELLYASAYQYNLPSHHDEYAHFYVDPNFIDITFVHSSEPDMRTRIPMKYRHFNFRVYPDCSVEFMGSYGDEIADKIMYPTSIETSYNKINLYSLDSSVTFYAYNLPQKFSWEPIQVMNSDSSVAIYTQNKVIPLSLGKTVFTFKNQYGYTKKCFVSVMDTTLALANYSLRSSTIESPPLSAISKENSTLVYPNPFSSWIYVQARQDWLSYQIEDLLGRTLLDEPYPTSNKIELHTLETGTYILVLKNTKGSFHRIKIVRE